MVENDDLKIDIAVLPIVVNRAGSRILCTRSQLQARALPIYRSRDSEHRGATRSGAGPSNGALFCAGARPAFGAFAATPRTNGLLLPGVANDVNLRGTAIIATHDGNAPTIGPPKKPKDLRKNS